MPRHVRWLGYAGPSTTTKPRHRGESDDGANTPHTLKMGGTMHEHNRTECCDEEPEVEREMTDAGDHGGHTVYRMTVTAWCPGCGEPVEVDA